MHLFGVNLDIVVLTGYFLLITSFISYWLRRKNYFYAIFLVLICLYSLPTLIGSLFLPGILSLYGACENRNVIYESILFSGVSVFLLQIFLMVRLPDLKLNPVQYEMKFGKYYAYFILVIIFSLVTLLEFTQLDNISYLNLSQNIDSLGITMKFLSFLVKSSWVILLFVCIFIWETKDRSKLLIFVCLLGAVPLTIFSFKAGNRSDFVVFFLGIIMYLITRYGVKLLVNKYFVTLTVCFVLFMNLIENDRQNLEVPQDLPISEVLLLKDYFAPYLILTSAIENSFVDPIYVMKSNFCNLFGFCEFPVLQEKLGNTMRPNSSSKTEGFGFFPFAEGYMFMGLLGVFYNCFIYGSILKVYNWIAVKLNLRVFIPVLASQLIYFIRSQSMYPLRFFILQFAIIVVLYFLLVGKVRFYKKPMRL